MKIRVSLKDPDALMEAIDESLEDLKVEGLTEDELEDLREKRKTSIYEECCDRWFKWGEYLVVEIDTEKMTCFVINAED
jgi:hypothetical protein